MSKRGKTAEKKKCVRRVLCGEKEEQKLRELGLCGMVILLHGGQAQQADLPNEKRPAHRMHQAKQVCSCIDLSGSDDTAHNTGDMGVIRRVLKSWKQPSQHDRQIELFILVEPWFCRGVFFFLLGVGQSSQHFERTLLDTSTFVLAQGSKPSSTLQQTPFRKNKKKQKTKKKIQQTVSTKRCGVFFVFLTELAMYIPQD